MNASRPLVCAILAVTSDTAFLDLKGMPNLIRAQGTLKEFFPSRTIYVASPIEAAAQCRDLLDASGANYQLILCDPCQPTSFAQALEPVLQDFQSILIHDAARPLVSHEQIERVLSSFSDDVDAIRPAIAFTETLKILGHSSEIKETLDRTSVRRVSSPEMIRASIVDSTAKDQGWFLPLKSTARCQYIESTALGQRINSTADRDLMEFFLD